MSRCSRPRKRAHHGASLRVIGGADCSSTRWRRRGRLQSESEPGTAVGSHSAPARAAAQGLGSPSTLRRTDNDTVDYVAGTTGAMDVSAPVTYWSDVGVAATAADEVDDGASSAARESASASASCASGRPRCRLTRLPALARARSRLRARPSLPSPRAFDMW